MMNVAGRATDYDSANEDDFTSEPTSSVLGEDEANSTPWTSENLSSYLQNNPIDGLSRRTRDIRPSSDFVSLITAISQAYQQDDYLDMYALDNLEWVQFGSGATFHVSKADMRFKVVSPYNSRSTEEIINRVVIKKTRNWLMTDQDVHSFIRELRILHHLHGAENIVELRGVGWLYNSNPVQPMPQPVLMLEEAEYTLRHLVGVHVDLPIIAMMNIFYDLASGLSALHARGVVHGDIKVDNVLLFPSHRYEEGKRIGTYIAKLSDFNLAMFDTGAPQYRLGGTSPYMAPECQDKLTFQGLKLTDVYALGVLYTIVASTTEDILDIDAHRHMIDHMAEPFKLEDLIMAQNRIDTEGSTFGTSLLDLCRDVFSMTLRTDAQKRCLDKLIQSFDRFFEHSQRSKYGVSDLVRLSDRQIISRGSQIESTITDIASEDVTIGYGKLMKVGGQIKDEIHKGLQNILEIGEDEPRYAKSAFEIGVFHLSKFSDPSTRASEGLRYVWTAAINGDLRARAIYGRLQRAYKCNSDHEYSQNCLEWLSDAASAGYQIALEELRALNPHRAQAALQTLAASNIKKIFGNAIVDTLIDVVNTPSESTTVKPRKLLTELTVYKAHLAASTGSSLDLESLIQDHTDLLNSRSPSSDTLLISACRYGQFETTLILLRDSADASITNTSGENAFHFLWHFTLSEAKILFSRLLIAGADPGAEAVHYGRADGWDLDSQLPGTPIERAISHNRLDLVKLFMTQGDGLSPINGNQLRRMLLLAIRFRHSDIQKYFITYASQSSVADSNLSPLRRVTWNYKGKRRSYLEAVVLGWVTQTGGDVDLPIDFWQACCHGEYHCEELRRTIHNVIHLSTRSEFDEGMLDDSIVLAVEERSYLAFEQLFATKILQTNGIHARALSLERFCWKADFKKAGSSRKSRRRVTDRILGMPIAQINYIDQLFHKPGTLTQMAMLTGDRRLYQILIDDFGADPSLPFQWRESSSQLNCYSLLADSFHKDMWFAYKLEGLSIGILFPFDEAGDTPPHWQHPLYCMLRERSWQLGLWAMTKGMSILDKTEDDVTVLDRILTIEPLSLDLLELLIKGDPDGSNALWSKAPSIGNKGTYPLFRRVYVTIMDRTSILNDEFLAAMASLWLNLLRDFPNAENQPSRKDQSILSMTLRLYRKLFYKTNPCMSFKLWIMPSVQVLVTMARDSDQTLDEGCGLVFTSVIPVSEPRIWNLGALRRLPASLLLGSPLDDLPVSTFLRHELWKHYCVPSRKHPGLEDVSFFEFMLVFVSSSFIPILFISWLLFEYWQKGLTHRLRFLLGWPILLLVWSSVVIGACLVIWILHIILGLVMYAINMMVRFVMGPDAVPMEFFDIDEPGSLPSFVHLGWFRWKREHRARSTDVTLSHIKLAEVTQGLQDQVHRDQPFSRASDEEATGP